MRTVKTAMRVCLNDVKSFLTLFVCPVAQYIYLLVASFVSSYWLATALRIAFEMSPGASGVAGSLIICSIIGGGFWVYTIVKRAKQQVKQENNNIIKSLSGEEHDYDERLWLD